VLNASFIRTILTLITENCSIKFGRRKSLEDLSVDGRIILKQAYILKIQNIRQRLDSSEIGWKTIAVSH
jgi:hypothetical protein